MRVVAAGLGLFVVPPGCFRRRTGSTWKRSGAVGHWYWADGFRRAGRFDVYPVPVLCRGPGRSRKLPPDEWQMSLLMMRARAVELLDGTRVRGHGRGGASGIEGLAQATSGTADGAEGCVQEQFGLTRGQFEVAVIRPLLFEQKIAETLPGETDAERVLAAQDLVEKRLQEKDEGVFEV